MSEMSDIKRIAFLGDVHLGSHPVALGKGLASLLQECAHVVVNLESPICKPCPRDSSKILLQSEPGVESSLSDWHVTCATLANNHIFDYGAKGFHDTCEALRSRQIVFAGAGNNLGKASHPLILDCVGTRVGIIPCAESVTQAQIATPNTPGCNHLRFPEIGYQVRNLKAKVDFLIVAPHWGFCDYAYPPIRVVSVGEQLLEAGADMIIGHHSHVVQGISRREDGRIVAYSLGDFYFNDYRLGRRIIRLSKENRQGLVLILNLCLGRSYEIELVYTRQRDFLIDIDTSKAREKIMIRRSKPLQKVEIYPTYWKKAVLRRFFNRVVNWLNPLKWKDISLATFSSALIMLWQMTFSSGNRYDGYTDHDNHGGKTH